MAMQLIEEVGEYGLARSPLFFYVYDPLWENEGFYYTADIYVWYGDHVTDKPAVPNLRLSRYPDAKNGAAFDVSDVCNSFLDDLLGWEAGAYFIHGSAFCQVEFGWTDKDGEHLLEEQSDVFSVLKGWSKYTEGINFDHALDSVLGKNRWLTDRHTTIRVYDGGYFTIALPYKSKDYGVSKVRIWDDAGNNYLYNVYGLIGTADNSKERVLMFQCGLNSWLTDNTDIGAKVLFNTKLHPVNEYYIQGEDAVGVPVTKKFTFQIIQYGYGSFYTIQFLNRYGVWDYLVCEGRKKMTLQVERSDVFRNPLKIDVGVGVSIESERGQYSVEVMGREGFTVNTGWLNEQDNELVKQLMMSKRVLCGESPDGGKSFQPLTVEMTSWEEKTQRGEKLISYDLTLRYANDYMNSVK